MTRELSQLTFNLPGLLAAATDFETTFNASVP